MNEKEISKTDTRTYLEEPFVSAVIFAICIFATVILPFFVKII